MDTVGLGDRPAGPVPSRRGRSGSRLRTAPGGAASRCSLRSALALNRSLRCSLRPRHGAGRRLRSRLRSCRVLLTGAKECTTPRWTSAGTPVSRGGGTLKHCQSGLLPPRALLSCIDRLLSRSRSVYTFRQRSHAGALQAAPGFVSRTRGRRGPWLTVPGPPVRQRRTPPGPGNPTDSDADRTLGAAFQKPV